MAMIPACFLTDVGDEGCCFGDTCGNDSCMVLTDAGDEGCCFGDTCGNDSCMVLTDAGDEGCRFGDTCGNGYPSCGMRYKSIIYPKGRKRFSMEELLELLADILPKVDFENGSDLVDDGVLDSLDIVSIISELSTHYDIEIPSDEITPENFNDAEAIYNLVERLLEE